ncbi:hypothetical protein [Hamadaea tsunoensis]|uniref:hypothetical protein n=1 Tax=Hamadaea tsunoensis TaxID=53368 RepID=UPI00048976AB|nr:hypothetical protein [Hamadaea tsunoensis]
MTWLDAIGWAGSALLVWSLLQTRILRLRAINLVGCVVLIGYNWAREVWPMVGLNVVLAVINIYFLVHLQRTRHDETAYAVVEVAPGDQYLGHMLAVHARDIEKFNPGFRRTGDEIAYLVVRGDETVGVVLLRDAGGGVAQIELDYVTQRFRDFTPGEFVYRQTALFTGRGFRTLRTPPHMVAPYYGRLGFRRTGDGYSLDLA